MTSAAVPPVVPVGTVVTQDAEDVLGLCEVPPQIVWLKNTEILADLSQYLFHLSADHKEDIQTLLSAFPELFSDVPSQTTVVSHDIFLTKTQPIKQRAYRINPTRRKMMKKEVEYLLEHGFAIPSESLEFSVFVGNEARWQSKVLY